MDKRLFLIDGHSIIFRMYYAFLNRPMRNSKGEDVSVLYGFTKYLVDIITKEKPTHLAVCFDPPGKTFRHTIYPEYKATRQAAPELVIRALEPLTEICLAMGIPVFMVKGFEGDDVLGTLAVRSAANGFKVFMVTPDKDFGQLINSDIYQYKPGKSGAENEIYGPAEICEKLKIARPNQIIDMLAICGDSADNVPGVKGVGEVGAAKLLAKWDTLEGIYEHLDELTPAQKKLFEDARDYIALSKELVTIKTDVPCDIQEDEMLLVQTHCAKVAELFDRYEFPSLKERLDINCEEKTEKTELPFDCVSPEHIVREAKSSRRCSIVATVDGESVFSTITGISIAVKKEDGTFCAAAGKVGDFIEILRSDSVEKTGYNLKLTDNLLHNAGTRLGGRLDDIELMHYLINPEQSHKIDVLCRRYIAVNVEDLKAGAKQEAEDIGLFDLLPEENVTKEDNCGIAVATYLLSDAIKVHLEEMALDKLYYQIEEPLIRVLARMERAGVRVDITSLAGYANSLEKEMMVIEGKVRTEAGEPALNLSSPKQIGTLLYEKLQIDPRLKAKKQSYPTDEETLMNYADRYPIINDILEYRGVKKLLGTYIEPFGGWISPMDGRIHTTFNQALTATGRLSSSRPNLQNIPIRTERGKEIRKAFVASDSSMVIVSADYSQIELRLMAHFCGDHNMLNAFCLGKDVHAITASKIFKLPLEEVTSEQRRMAKTANFGIMYGISAFGLSQRLNISRTESKKIIDDYFDSFPTIKEWIEKTRESASVRGYVETLFGRRRYLPDINSRNATARALAERNAVNAPIQGTAADIIKMAMNKVDLRIRNAALKSKMVLQIHDELVFEAPVEEVDQLMEIIKSEMENVLTLSVPLTVECNYGKNWLEAH